jgi:predicted ATP-grasp superfamily ATP-dependent carboligase
LPPIATQKSPVLILGVEPRITIPVARSLNNIGVRVAVGSISSHDPTLHSNAIFAFRRLPTPDHPSFVAALAAFIREHSFDTLIPTTDGALAAVSRHYDGLSRLLRLSCPRAEIIDHILNKEATLSIAARSGIRVPREFAVTDSAGIAAIPQLTFPVVAKPRQKSAGETFKVRYFSSAAELSAALASGALEGALLQEYCPGEGVGVEMLIHNGDCVAAFQHRRLKEVPHTGGAAAMAVAEALDPKLKETALHLLRALEWEGVAMVEFRHDAPTGSTALMEVNGRYWGTVACALNAGVDFPVYEWQLAHGEIPNVPSAYAVGMCWRWKAGMLKRWHGIVTGSKSSPGTSAAASYGNSPTRSQVTRDALWMASDPMPAIFEWLRTAKILALHDAKAIARKLLPRRAIKALKS